MLVIERLSETAVLPRRAHDSDAGYDLYTSEDTILQPDKTTDVKLGFRMELPNGYYARIIGRSSTMRKRRLLVVEGIIDTGYRGELYVGVYNPTGYPIRVNAGERLAQMLIHENFHWLEVKEGEVDTNTDEGGGRLWLNREIGR